MGEVTWGLLVRDLGGDDLFLNWSGVCFCSVVCFFGMCLHIFLIPGKVR